MVAQTMAQNILDGLHLRAQHVRSLIDLSRENPEHPVAFLDVQESVRSSLSLRDYLTDACKLFWDEAFNNLIDHYQSAGHLCLAGFDVALKTFAVVKARVELAASQGVPADVKLRLEEDIAAVESASAQVLRMRGDFAARWPWVKSDLLAQSLADQGPRRSVKGLFDELRHRNRQVS